MISLNSCPVCHNTNITQYQQSGIFPIVMHEIMPGVTVKAGIITNYFVCQTCHVIFQNPRLLDKELDKFYAEGFYRRTLNMTDENANADEAGRAKFDAEVIKNKISNITTHLDVGCSRGYLLTEVGAIVKVGVDPDISRLKKSDIEAYSSIDEVPQKSFDLVTAIHTLEHVSDPMRYLKDMAKLVSKNGHLVIEVPTWKSPGGPLRFAHLYHFEPDALRMMCREVGLKVIETKFTPHLMLICKTNRD